MKNTKDKSILSLLLCGSLLLSAACKKTKSQQNPPESVAKQEQALLGKWVLKKSETYEVSGADSSGQYQCTLVDSSSSDSGCKIEFKGEHPCTLCCSDFIGSGLIGSCDAKNSFSWNVKKQNKLDVNFGTVYDIVYLSSDSVALSNMYQKDILKLKSVFYYKRN